MFILVSFHLFLGLYLDSLTSVFAADPLEVSQSLFVIADLDSDDGLDLVKESLLSLACLPISYFLCSHSCIIFV